MRFYSRKNLRSGFSFLWGGGGGREDLIQNQLPIDSKKLRSRVLGYICANIKTTIKSYKFEKERDEFSFVSRPFGYRL